MASDRTPAEYVSSGRERGEGEKRGVERVGGGEERKERKGGGGRYCSEQSKLGLRKWIRGGHQVVHSESQPRLIS